MKSTLIMTALLLLLVGCARTEQVQPTATADITAELALESPAEPETVVPAAPTTTSAAETPAEAGPATVEPPATLTTTSAAETPAEAGPATVEPIEVTYFTPAQQEGPYYTVAKPADRDNDLVDFAGASAPPLGQVLVFGGIVYGADGWPLPGVTVEIWQTDAGGVYLHPDDPGTDGRDRNFQFYGESVTDESGQYEFRTILPGLYEPRPRHIHFKVGRDGEELLTSQFYFVGEIDLQGEEGALLVATEAAGDADGNPILLGRRDIILNDR